MEFGYVYGVQIDDLLREGSIVVFGGFLIRLGHEVELELIDPIHLPTA